MKIEALLPDIDNNAHAPHVQRPVESFVPQDFGSQIGRCSHDASAEGLLSNYSSKAEVTQFDLQL